MVDLLPPPITGEQRIEQALHDCGLPAKNVSVRYEEDLQGVVITILKDASVPAESFSCLAEAARTEILLFEDAALGAAFAAFNIERLRPRMLAEATANMERLGLLSGMPKRAAFADLASFAEALEQHAGLDQGSTLTAIGDEILFHPRAEPGFPNFIRKYEKLIATMMYAGATGDFEDFAFMGNEAVMSAPNAKAPTDE